MPHPARLVERKDFLARATLSWEYAPDCFHKDSALIQDRSAGGLGIQLAKAVPVGTNVSVAHTKDTYYGIVKHCSKVKERCLLTGRQQFLIGIEFVPAKDV